MKEHLTTVSTRTILTGIIFLNLFGSCINRTLIGSSELVKIIKANHNGKCSIAGRVLDVKGKPLRAANILLLDTEVGVASNKSGYFKIINLTPGQYNLKVTYIGFKEGGFQNLSVNRDETAILDFRLVTDPYMTLIECPIVK